jgi:hypothetical protein
MKDAVETLLQPCLCNIESARAMNIPAVISSSGYFLFATIRHGAPNTQGSIAIMQSARKSSKDIAWWRRTRVLAMIARRSALTPRNPLQRFAVPRHGGSLAPPWVTKRRLAEFAAKCGAFFTSPAPKP